MIQLLHYLWAAPTTALGLLAAILTAPGGHRAFVGGVLEVHGPAVAWALARMFLVPGGAAALTLGHVVLARSAAMLDETRAHERVHVAQCERWGPLFVPAYLAAGAWAWARGRHPYFDNPFEREAFAAARGDYQVMSGC